MDKDGRDLHHGTRDLEPLDQLLHMLIVMSQQRHWLQLLLLILIMDQIFRRKKVQHSCLHVFVVISLFSIQLFFVVCVHFFSFTSEMKKLRQWFKTNYPTTTLSFFRLAPFAPIALFLCIVTMSSPFPVQCLCDSDSGDRTDPVSGR